MQEQINILKQILVDQRTIHDNLISVAAKMSEAIKKQNISDVKYFTSCYDEYLAQIETLEHKRLAICDCIAKELKSPSKHINLQTIIQQLPQKEEKENLSKLRTELKSRINDFARINSSNELILNEYLLDIGNQFQMITKVQNKLTGYKQSGEMDKTSIRNSIVNHIA